MENKENIFKMFKIPGHESWIVHNDALRESKRFISRKSAQNYRNEQNKEIERFSPAFALEKEGVVNG